eukprot:TRINITY_DN1727_c1_g1_i5.p1 TRINITY_DN1727_c1_g1~~TRINITY_DN1727_c1_g1_i5.p1  ORF type:complete len:213 (-),score=28.35 TRINITY_DN1727_c1_g1_i5:46-684(-)
MFPGVKHLILTDCMHHRWTEDQRTWNPPRHRSIPKTWEHLSRLPLVGLSVEESDLGRMPLDGPFEWIGVSMGNQVYPRCKVDEIRFFSVNYQEWKTDNGDWDHVKRLICFGGSFSIVDYLDSFPNLDHVILHNWGIPVDRLSDHIIDRMENLPRKNFTVRLSGNQGSAIPEEWKDRIFYQDLTLEEFNEYDRESPVSWSLAEAHRCSFINTG